MDEILFAGERTGTAALDVSVCAIWLAIRQILVRKARRSIDFPSRKMNVNYPDGIRREL